MVKLAEFWTGSKINKRILNVVYMTKNYYMTIRVSCIKMVTKFGLTFVMGNQLAQAVESHYF